MISGFCRRGIFRSSDVQFVRSFRENLSVLSSRVQRSKNNVLRRQISTKQSHWTELQEWADPRCGLGVLQKRKNSLFLQGFESLKGLKQKIKFGRYTKNSRHDSLDKIRREIVTLDMKNNTCFSRHCERHSRYTVYSAVSRVANRGCGHNNMMYEG